MADIGQEDGEKDKRARQGHTQKRVTGRNRQARKAEIHSGIFQAHRPRAPFGLFDRRKKQSGHPFVQRALRRLINL